MPLDQIPSNLPVAAIVLGAIVLLWSQRERLASLWAKVWPLGCCGAVTLSEPEVTVIADGYQWTGPTSAYVYLYEQLDPEARAALKRELWPAVHRAVFGPDDACLEAHEPNGGPST